MKAKRKLGNKYTVLEYQLPLARLGLDSNGNQYVFCSYICAILTNERITMFYDPNVQLILIFSCKNKLPMTDRN